MSAAEVVYGLLPAGDELEATVRDLRTHGIYTSEIEVLVPRPGRYRLADEILHEDARAARRGAAVGAAVGAAIGAAVGVLVPTVEGAGTTTVVFIALAVAGFSALVGAMVGLQGHDLPDDDPERWREIVDGEAVRLVAVRCLHWRNRAHAIMERHGVVFLDPGSPGLN